MLEKKFAEAVELHKNGLNEKAIELYKEILQINPRIHHVYANLAVIYKSQNKALKAIKYFEKAVQINHDNPSLYYALAELYIEIGNSEKGEECLNRILAIDQNCWQATYKLGRLYQDRCNYEKAIQCFNNTLNINPSFVKAYISLAFIYRVNNNNKKALSCFQKAVNLDPGSPLLQFWLAEVNLRSGNLYDGFIGYEFRKKHPDYAPAFNIYMDLPQWNGEFIYGKKILVYCEQGLGDILQFIRYLPLVKTRGGHVFFLSRPPLTKLLENYPGIDCMLEEADIHNFDLSVSIMSLPMIFGTTINTIPSNKTPYIKPCTNTVAKWERYINNNSLLKVGIVWSGRKGGWVDDLKRSCHLTDFSPLKNIKNVAFYSLQIDEAAKEINNTEHGLTITDLSPFINDFNDTAGAIMNLDLVISIDTSVAHLAGALGKTAWIALPFVAEWRWLTDREDSPWYPTLKLFRQEKEDDWNSVFVRMADDLNKIVQNM